MREQQNNQVDANVVLIEDKASGTQLIQELIQDGCHGVTLEALRPLIAGNSRQSTIDDRPDLGRPLRAHFSPQTGREEWRRRPLVRGNAADLFARATAAALSARPC